MNKRYVNGLSRGSYKFVLLVFGPCLIIYLWLGLHFYDDLFSDSFVRNTFLFFGFLLLLLNGLVLWELLLGSMSMTYELTKDGITTYRRGKSYFLGWSACVEAKFVPQMVAWATSIPVVYFAVTPLDKKKALRFMLHYGNRPEIIQYFQCDQERLEELNQVMPGELHSTLYSSWYGIKDYLDDCSSGDDLS